MRINLIATVLVGASALSSQTVPKKAVTPQKKTCQLSRNEALLNGGGGRMEDGQMELLWKWDESGMSQGYYKCASGKLELDGELTAEYQKGLERAAKEEKHRANLVQRAKTEVLSDAEWKELKEAGAQILVPVSSGFSVSYYQEQIDRQYNELILQQYRIREITARPCSK